MHRNSDWHELRLSQVLLCEIQLTIKQLRPRWLKEKQKKQTTLDS